jgi:hypothetical protein
MAHRTVTTAVLQRLQFYLTRSSYVSMNPVRKGLCERAEDLCWIIDRFARWQGGSARSQDDGLLIAARRRY